MRARLLLGSLAAATAIATTVPVHAAEPRLYCGDGFEVVCTVVAITCWVTGEDPCHP